MQPSLNIYRHRLMIKGGLETLPHISAWNEYHWKQNALPGGPGGHMRGWNYSLITAWFRGVATGSGRFSTLESLISFLGHTVAQRPQLVHLE